MSQDEMTDVIACPVTAEHATRFARDGVVSLPGLLTDAQVEAVRAVIATELDAAWRRTHDDTEPARARRFYNDGDLWRRHPPLRRLVLSPALAGAAARLLGSTEVRLLMDEAFVKEPSTALPVPCHADLAYWPLCGRQALSFWIALDEVGPDNGAVEFVVGSHRWAQTHAPVSFLATDDDGDLPDIDRLRTEHDVVSWALAPGDAIAFHAYTLHASPGNSSSTRRRRGYTVRYLGDDIRYDPRPGTSPMMQVPGLSAGAALPEERCPLVWPARARLDGHGG